MPSNSNTRRPRRKSRKRPAKPYAEFPLYAHPLGYWSKKINKKIIHFGRWGRVVKGKLQPLPFEESWQAALAAFKARVDDAHAGRIEGVVVDLDEKQADERVLVKDVCNEFRTAKKKKMDAGRLGRRMYEEYVSVTDLLFSQFGGGKPVDDLNARDFELLREYMETRWGPVRLANQITRVKTVFKYAYEKELIAKPIPCLQAHSSIFAAPSRDELRRHRSSNGKRMLTSEECRTLVEAASIPLRAMMLLGLNCGYGNHDCATLPLSALDLAKGWIDYPRPKTGIERRCPLWSETVSALRAAIAERPETESDDAAKSVFLTARGRPWLSGGIANPVSVAARVLMKDAGVHRTGLGFYTLRHVFRTVADGARDQVAANSIMGHSDSSTAATYREYIDDARLLAVTDHVHNWLFEEGSER